MAVSEVVGRDGEQPARGPVRVLVVDRRFYETGSSRSTLQLVRRWLDDGVPVTVVALQRAWEGNAAAIPEGVEVVYPSPPRARLARVLALGTLRVVREALRADVLVTGRGAGYGLLVAALAARLARRPVVVVVRVAPGPAIERWVPPRLRALTRLAYRTSTRLACISAGLVPAVEEVGGRADRIRVVLNGIDVDAVRSAAGRSRASAPEEVGPVVVGVGRLERQKGFDLLVRAHARALAAGVPHRLLVLGEGPDRAALEGLVAELGVAGSVSLPGFDPDPLPVVAAADLFCLPSRYEGFGRSLAEALVLGTPCVAADCVSGPRELLAGGERGDLVPVEDVDALADAVVRHLRAPDRLRAAARDGRGWALEHLDDRRTARELLAVLQEAVTAHRSCRRVLRGPRARHWAAPWAP